MRVIDCSWFVSRNFDATVVQLSPYRIILLSLPFLVPSLNSFSLCHSSYHNAVRSLGTKQSKIYTLSTTAISTFYNLALHYILCFSLLPSIWLFNATFACHFVIDWLCYIFHSACLPLLSVEIFLHSSLKTGFAIKPRGQVALNWFLTIILCSAPEIKISCSNPLLGILEYFRHFRYSSLFLLGKMSHINWVN